jgi:DNA/RNA-binding domain of Phe-tRNA-synthetase-like protein
MKIRVAPSLFDRISGLCIGIVAVRAADNAAANMEAEAFRRRCCTEANLLLKMDPALAEKELEDYREILSAAGVKEGRTAVEKVFAEYRKLLGVSAAEGVPEDPEILLQPKKATFDELAGSDALPPVNPIMDIIRGGMLKFHVEIHAYDMGNRKTPLEIREAGRTFSVNLGDKVCTADWLCRDEEAGAVTEDTENILVLITGMKGNRRKVAAARNELARRMKSAFDRAVEVGWLEGKETEFTTEI